MTKESMPVLGLLSVYEGVMSFWGGDIRRCSLCEEKMVNISRDLSIESFSESRVEPLEILDFGFQKSSKEVEICFLTCPQYLL